MPAADLEVTVPLVRRLLAEQHPDLADRPLSIAAEGWDTVTLRLGDDLAVRMPRRTVAAHLIEHEQQVLPQVAALLPVPVPVPVRLGRPDAAFPWAWSVVPWFEGVPAADAGVADDPGFARDLAAVLLALHVPAPADAPVNPVRGTPFGTRNAVLRERLASGRVARSRELDRVRAAALAAPLWDRPPTWLHGDPHPANLIVRGGRLAAVIDFGDACAGDPATDVATAWLTFGPAGRAAFRTALGPDAATWVRARGWAAVMATAMVTMSEPGSVTERIGAAALEQVLLD